MKRLIEEFNPAWGAAVMGTGVLTILSTQVGDIFSTLSIVLFAINTGVLVYALVCWLLMWVVTPGKIRSIVDNASMLVFLPTVPIGVVVYANSLIALKPAFFPGLGPLFPAVLWLLGSAAIVILAVHFLDRIFSSRAVDIKHSTFGWLIPPVALLVIPLGVPSVVGAFSPGLARVVVFFSFASWGAGFFSYLFVNAAVMHRYFFHEMPAAQMTPSVWVGLGPLGAGAAGLFAYARVAAAMPFMRGVEGFSNGLGILMWGFGLIWYFLALVLTMRKTILERIPYSMGWWAFTFPLGAYALATRLLYAQTGLPVLQVFFWVLFANLWVFWIVTAYKTATYFARRG